MGKSSKRKNTEINNFLKEMSQGASRIENFLRRPVIWILLIIIIGFFIYSNTFKVPFLFDDSNTVLKNTSLRDSDYLTNTSLTDIFSASRLIGQLTFALNHAVDGFNVVGYHLVNLLIHVGCALLLYWFYILTFKTPYVSDHFPKRADSFFQTPKIIALFTALLFVSHPVQTQAVTYIVQRYASLATFFYLFSLVMYIKFRLSESPKAKYVFYAVSIFSAILAMKTKEIAFTLPLMVILYEFLFFRGEIRKRILYLIPLTLTMIIIPLSLIGVQSSSPGSAVRIDELTKGASLNIISTGDYLNTQFRVIVTYIRLLFLPINQNLDYDYPIYKTFFTPPVFFSFGFLLMIFGWGVYLLYRSGDKESSLKPDSRFRGKDIKLRNKTSGDENERKCWYRLIAFGIFWFFVTISVESSIIPIADVIFEHRLYLPSLGFFMAIMAGVMWFTGKWVNKPLIKKTVLTAMILVIVVLSVTAYARNGVWRDEVTLWEDVVKKSPNKARPHNNLGGLFLKDNHIDEAVIEIMRTLRIDPDYAEAHHNLGLALEKRGQINEAIAHYSEAIRLNPGYAAAHSNLGAALQKKGRWNEAGEHFNAALQINPAHEEANNNKGLILEREGQIAEAIHYYNIALRINPNYADAQNNLGNLLIRTGEIDAAIAHIAIALKVNPNFAEAEFNMGNAFLLKGIVNDAVPHYKKALNINPDYAEAHNNLGSALMRLGNYDEAIGHYRKALLIRGNYEDAGKNLQIALKKVKKQNDGSHRN
jgi:tetratricopeptide (TPR) repeat protein